MISVSGCSLSAGRALNPSALAPAGFTCHARPAGVSHLALQSTIIEDFSQKCSQSTIF
ncbi:hypothetical protein [Fictibacillus sp. FJAT-27399]|uniref:hypothetical protein n=1 Tax=Fictibacillus sp. FJAT-27399 TaxID=1729689 RepID=UPI0012E358EE|nr:hypothetical protein [Fictibacillus sp. FJAT-27399]